MSITPNPDRPATVPPPMSRAAKAEALLRRFTAEAHRRKWSYDRGLDDDGVPVPSDDFMALHRLGEDMRMALEELRRTEPSAVSVVPPATNQPALRDRIADAIRDAACPGECGKTEEECARERIQPFAWHHGRVAVVEGEPEMFADAVLGVLPAPADRAAGWLDAADAIDRLRANLSPSTAHRYESGLGLAATELRRLAAEAPHTETPGDVDPVYDPRAWETYRRAVGCGCTAPAPVDCKILHGTGAWLCVCHRLSGPPVKDSDPPGTFLSSEDEALRKHFTHPNRCTSANGVFRCSRPVSHAGDHRTGRTFWTRRAGDSAPAVVAQPGKETRPCGECSHPKDAHQDGDDPVTPGTCSACEADDPDEARHDYRAGTAL